MLRGLGLPGQHSKYEGPAPRCAQQPSPVRASPSAQGQQRSAKAASGASWEYELTQAKGPCLGSSEDSAPEAKSGIRGPGR